MRWISLAAILSHGAFVGWGYWQATRAKRPIPGALWVGASGAMTAAIVAICIKPGPWYADTAIIVLTLVWTIGCAGEHAHRERKQGCIR